MNLLRTLSIILIPLVLLASCGGDYGQYAQAVKEQNLTIQLRLEQQARQKEHRQMKHQEKMMAFATQAMAAATVTADKSDDLMIPMVIMLVEDKWAVAEVMAAASAETQQMQQMRAPETVGETIQKSTAAILGIGGIALGIVSSNNTAKIATAGITAAGPTNTISGSNNTVSNDSFKSGTDNVTTGNDNSSTSGDIVTTQSSDSSSDSSSKTDDNSTNN